MKLGLYCVARYKRAEEGAEREFLEYGAPFVEFSDDSAIMAVRESIRDVKDKLDLGLFALVKVGEFYPDSYESPVAGATEILCEDMICSDCSSLFDEVKVDE